MRFNPSHPPVVRDLNVERGASWAELETHLKTAAGEWLESIELIDVHLDRLTVRLTWRHAARTLRKAEVDAIIVRLAEVAQGNSQ